MWLVRYLISKKRKLSLESEKEERKMTEKPIFKDSDVCWAKREGRFRKVGDEFE